MRTSGKLALLSTLYLSQGLPFGFFTKALPAMLRQQEASLTAIGFTSLLATPWMLKFLWAPLVDRWGWSGLGHRRSWIVPLQLLTIVLMLAAMPLDPEEQLPVILGVILLANLLAATQDVATDGLAVSVLSEHERGLGNGIQVAGYRLGMILGGGVLLILFEALGWRGVFQTMALILAVATVPVLFFREAPRAVAPSPTWMAIAKDLLARRGMARWLALLVIFKLGEQLGGGVTTPMFVDLGLEMDEIGWMLGLTGSLASLVGALLGGWLTGRVGRRRALLWFGLLQATGLLVYVIPAWTLTASTQALYAITIYDSVVGSMATVALFTAMMDACDPRQGGTDYTFQASVVVAASGFGAAFSGLSADTFGYVGHFVLAGLLTVAGAITMAALYRLPTVPMQSTLVR